MISVPIPELPTWFIRYEEGNYYVDRNGKLSRIYLPKSSFKNYPEQLKIIDRKLKLQKLLGD